MKVLIVDQILRVNYKYTISLAKALIKQGVSVDIIGDVCETAFEGINVENLFITSEEDKGKIEKALNYKTTFDEILRRVKGGKYDVVHLQWFQLSPLDAAFIKSVRKTGTKLVITVHDILPFNRAPYDKFFHKIIYENADSIIVQAENNIDRFDREFPESKSKVIYIPHGHFLDYANRINKAEAREKLDIKPHKCVALFFGQIKKVKGIGVLLEAYGKYLSEQNGQNTLLIIAGKPWKDSFEHYSYLINKYKKEFETTLRLDIRYIPEEEVALYYSAADFCVMPYLDVYQSGVIQLSYAYGVPVVSSDLPAFSEVVIDGVTGYVSKTGDSDSLSEAFAKAVANKNGLSKMGRMGQDYIREKFSWDSIAQSVIQLYKS